MRILFLTHYFPPEVNAPASRTFEHAQVWIKDGHEVEVITNVPHHPQGKIYPGYRNGLCQSDEIKGIEIRRVLGFITPNRGKIRRTINYGLYMIMTVLVSPFVKRPDVVVSTTPQFFAGLAGFFVSRIKRVPWVLEVRDLWPQSIVTVGAMQKKSRRLAMLEWVERFCYRHADHVVSVTDSFTQRIVERGGHPDRVSVVKNGVDLNFFNPDRNASELAREWGIEGKFVASYVGTHGLAHGLETVLEAADLMREREDIVFLLIGDGAQKTELLEKKAAMKVDNVLMLDQQPKYRMPEIWSLTDASMVLLRDAPLFHEVIPSKIFESMAMKRPIILGVQGECEGIVTDAGAGICIQPQSAEELAAAVIRLADDRELGATIGESASQFVAQHFNRVDLARQFEAVMRRHVHTKPEAELTERSSY